MTCYHPLTGYRAAETNPDTGKRGITFNPLKSLMGAGHPIKLPCGQCSGCRADRAHDWAMRCTHEAHHDRLNNSFITLTYSDDHVPQSFSISVREMQLFLKRLRKRFGKGIRFFCVGEYGDLNNRPHYHLLIYGCSFPDKIKWSTRDGQPVYRSEALAELWPYGNHEIGSLTKASAGYVARYCIKKQTGKKADTHYRRISPVNGESYFVTPEFATMSRGGRAGGGGIGSRWFAEFKGDAFPSDFLVSEGRKVRPPSFYLKQLSDVAADPIKRARKRRAATPAAKANSTPQRLAVREFIHAERIKRLKREL